jgi:beta-lactamase regulating signal transducer with metallopeptidase domain
MNSLDFTDPILGGRICLTLLHSVWQIALLAMVAWVIERCRRRLSAEWSYRMHVALLCLGVAAAPLTYSLVQSPDSRIAIISQTAAENREADERPVLGGAAVKATDADQAAFSRASSPTAASAAERTRSWRKSAGWIIAVYFLGVVLMLIRLLAALFYAHRMASQAKPLTDGPLFSAIQALAHRWSMGVAPLLAETELVVVPRVVGLVRPVLLVPVVAVSGLTFDELELILAHELAHVRRHDMWIVLVQRLAEAVLFYNPALWYLSRRISTLREYCCDDLACAAPQSDAPLRYSAALVKLIEIAAPEILPRANAMLLAACGRSPSELRRRVARLLGEPLREPLRITRGAALAAGISLLLLAFLPVISHSKAQQSEKAPSIERKDQAPSAAANHRFSFGGRIEVLALGTHERIDDHWWDAEGKPLKSLPAPLVGCLARQTDEQGEPLASLPVVWKTGADQIAAGNVVWRRIVLRVANLPDGADVTWKILGANAYGGSDVSVEGERNPRGYYSRYFGVPVGQKTTTIKVGVAAGEWKTEAEGGPGGMAAIGKEGKGIVFSEVFDTPGGPAVIVSHDYFDQDFRVVAFDKQGTLHDSGRGGASGGKVYQTRATFRKLKRDEIDHFEFQTRDYEYVETAALPLEPPAKP